MKSSNPRTIACVQPQKALSKIQKLPGAGPTSQIELSKNWPRGLLRLWRQRGLPPLRRRRVARAPGAARQSSPARLRCNGRREDGGHRQESTHHPRVEHSACISTHRQGSRDLARKSCTRTCVSPPYASANAAQGAAAGSRREAPQPPAAPRRKPAHGRRRDRPAEPADTRHRRHRYRPSDPRRTPSDPSVCEFKSSRALRARSRTSFLEDRATPWDSALEETKRCPVRL